MGRPAGLFQDKRLQLWCGVAVPGPGLQQIQVDGLVLMHVEVRDNVQWAGSSGRSKQVEAAGRQAKETQRQTSESRSSENGSPQAEAEGPLCLPDMRQ